jgi:hypothetical protein
LPGRGAFLLLIATAILLAATQARATPARDLEGIRVVLDPGHGGDDWGVDPAGSGLQENVSSTCSKRAARRSLPPAAQIDLSRLARGFASRTHCSSVPITRWSTGG